LNYNYCSLRGDVLWRHVSVWDVHVHLPEMRAVIYRVVANATHSQINVLLCQPNLKWNILWCCSALLNFMVYNILISTLREKISSTSIDTKRTGRALWESNFNQISTAVKRRRYHISRCIDFATHSLCESLLIKQLGDVVFNVCLKSNTAPITTYSSSMTILKKH